MTKFNIKPSTLVTTGLSTAGVGISAANYITNKKRSEESKEYQKKQLEAMDKLTSSLNNVNTSLGKLPAEKPVEKKRRRKFGLGLFQKNNSNTTKFAYKGAIIGGTLAGGAIPFIPGSSKITTDKTTFIPGKSNGPNYEYKETVDRDGNIEKEKITRDKNGTTISTGSTKFTYKNRWDSMNPFYKKALIELGGVAIGAGLGALAGMIMDVSDYINKKKTVNNRLLKDVVDNLKKTGYKEGKDYTRDPKMSNLLKTKVCLVVSRNSDDLKLLINTINDGKLRNITKDIVKNLPTLSTLTEKVSDRYNELNITTMTSNSGDAVWISSVAEKFIKAGYPVYLVEVG